jgi:hypothetical protein
LHTGRNRKGGDPRELGFHVIQVLEQLIKLGGPPQLLILIDLGKHDRARLPERDDVGWIETSQAAVLAAERHYNALKPILFSLPVAQRMGLQQVIDSPRLGRGATHRNPRRPCVAERFTFEGL